jgi:Tol biopolymer transport system component
MNRLDLRAGNLILIILLALVGVIALGSQISVGVHLTGPFTQDILQVGPNGPINFVFSRAVQEDLVSPVVSFQPPLPGKLNWSDASHAEFVPDHPIQPSIVYTVTVGPGAVGKSGEVIRGPISLRFELRQPMVVYISGELGAANLWTAGLSGDPAPRQITHAPGTIWDYAPAPNGEQIIYSMINAQNGMDLWTVGRDGQANHILLACGPDRCSTASWCQDSQRVVFNRQGAGISIGAPLGAPRPWLMDTKTGETKPLYEDEQVIGDAPSWSPDCHKVASIDGIDGGIQILDLQTRKNVFIPSISGTGGSWSVDSQSIYFTDVVAIGTDDVVEVFKADVNTGQTERIFNSKELTSVTNYDSPVMSPRGGWLAVGVRSSNNVPGSQIWLVSENGATIQVVTKDPNYTYDEYAWDSSGDNLVFRGLKLGSTEGSNLTSVWVAHSGQLTLIANNATTPFWLP